MLGIREMKILTAMIISIVSILACITATQQMKILDFRRKIAFPKYTTMDLNSLESANRTQLLWAIDVLNKQNTNTDSTYKEILGAYRIIIYAILGILLIESIVLCVILLKTKKAFAQPQFSPDR